ncbi:alpha-L-fucosidase [Arcanobacterium hippocoleae]
MSIIEQRTQRTQWFCQDRFGMFIHWGLYAIPGRGEWVRSDEEIRAADYRVYFDEWNPVRCDMRQWAQAAKNAGMKYAVLTAKHHEGFALWDTQYSDFKTTNTACKRDFVKEYAEAFREAGLKVGIYFSLLDWEHPDFPAYSDRFHADRNHEEFKDRTHDWNQYLDFMHGQVRELMSNYGKIDLLWFDFSYDEHIAENWRGKELLEMVRSLQPEIVINGRLEGSGESYGSIMTDNPSIYSGDFTCPEMIIPPRGLVTPSGQDVPWEACFTLDNNWGYAPNDRHHKNAAQIVRKLVECVSKHGNMIVNVSPTAKGELPEWQLEVLAQVGKWMHRNSESIYGCGRADLPKPEWGRYTQKDGVVYAHVTEAAIGALALPGLKGRVQKIRRLADGFEMRVLTPWVAKEFPDCEFVNYGVPDYFSFTPADDVDEVLEITLCD